MLFCIYKLLYCYLVHCLHYTVIQLFGYLYSRRCSSKLIVLVIDSRFVLETRLLSACIRSVTVYGGACAIADAQHSAAAAAKIHSVSAERRHSHHLALDVIVVVVIVSLT